jgi:hypothetical protein
MFLILAGHSVAVLVLNIIVVLGSFELPKDKSFFNGRMFFSYLINSMIWLRLLA